MGLFDHVCMLWTEGRGSQQLTCLMAVTVMTKKRGRPLVMGEVGVSIINWRETIEAQEASAKKRSAERRHKRGCAAPSLCSSASPRGWTGGAELLAQEPSNLNISACWSSFTPNQQRYFSFLRLLALHFFLIGRLTAKRQREGRNSGFLADVVFLGWWFSLFSNSWLINRLTDEDNIMALAREQTQTVQPERHTWSSYLHQGGRIHLRAS